MASSRKNLLWFGSFFVVSLICWGLGMYFEARGAEAAADRYLRLWETEIAHAALMGESSESVDKIYRQIEEFHPSLRLLKPGMKASECPMPVSQRISLYSLPASSVTVCRDPVALAGAGLRSPVFFTSFLLAAFGFLFFLRRDHQQELRRLAAESEARFALVAQQVAHDIRGPLSALQILTQNITTLEPEQKKTLLEVSTRIHSTAEDLLRRTRVVAPVTGGVQTAIDDVIADLLGEMRLRFPERTLAESLQSGGRLAVTRSDLQRAVANLIQNAVDASPSGAPIVVATREYSSHVSVLVTDEGAGMSEEQLRTLREGKRVSSKAEGHGLGLAFVRALVEKVGGDFLVESRQGQGTQVELRFKKTT